MMNKLIQKEQMGANKEEFHLFLGHHHQNNILEAFWKWLVYEAVIIFTAGCSIDKERRLDEHDGP
jgi:hypothetical protein